LRHRARVSVSRVHPPGKSYKLEFRLPKDDNKITSALTYEGSAGRRKKGRTGLQGTLIEVGNGPIGSS